MDVGLIAAYLTKNAPVWVAIFVLLVLYMYPGIGKVIAEKIIPARIRDRKAKLDAELKVRDTELKFKREDIEWERARILREEAARNKQLETLEDIGKTLVLMHVALENSNQDHKAIVVHLDKMAQQSEDEHKNMLTVMNAIQHLYSIMITRLEERRKTDFTSQSEK